MRPATRDRASFAEATGPDLLDALPTCDRPRAPRAWPWLALRALGALSLLATGAVHLQQFARLYHAIPTIGALFVLNFAGASATHSCCWRRWSGSQAAGARPCSSWRPRRASP